MARERTGLGLIEAVVMGALLALFNLASADLLLGQPRWVKVAVAMAGALVIVAGVMAVAARVRRGR